MAWKELNARTRGMLKELNKTIPETAKGFQALSAGVKVNGVLEFKQKEFVALGIAVATHCEACIGLHIEALIRIGATREEVADAMEVVRTIEATPTVPGDRPTSPQKIIKVERV